MSLPAAQLIVTAVGAYAAVGLLFAVFFAWRLVGRLDRAAIHGTLGFRLLIVPGTVAFWPYLAMRLVAGASAPPDEWTAHRALAGTRQGRQPRQTFGRSR